MLVITRKKDESILIGDDIEIKIIKIDDRSVKLAIDAPRDKVILRKEIYENVKDENSKAIANIDDIFKLFK
ncbi:carbon storage regulator CsrA [[Eubacterium] tenue]|nr:carbon storage regulator CsrA [[Eubacterium] tenue]MBC8631666.1 carbon storage regulator CsrA [[Eubacterium] tenue]